MNGKRGIKIIETTAENEAMPANGAGRICRAGRAGQITRAAGADRTQRARRISRAGRINFLNRAVAFLLAAVMLISLANPLTASAGQTTAVSDPAKISLGEQHTKSNNDTLQLTYGDSGVLMINESASTYSALGEIQSVTFKSANTDRLSVESDGSYSACGYGTAAVTATVTYIKSDSTSASSASYKYKFCVYPDMSAVTLDTSSLVLYYSEDCYMDITAEVNISSSYSFSDDDSLTTLSLKSSKKALRVSGELENNVLTLTFKGSGSATVTVTLNGTAYKISVQLVEVAASTDAVLLYAGQTKTVKVTGTASGASVKWSSSKKSVATVSSSGKITAKKTGNAIITATVDGQVKVGCVVSVTSKKKVKAIKKAISIYESSSYSQSKRMRTGYYDCSSLVWRSYSPQGYYFGKKSTAPVAASIASYLNKKGKLKTKYTYAQTQKMIMYAGDLLFKTGAKNGRYRGIYHVELFTGYALAYYDADGDPVVTTTWATRADGYADSGNLYGRP